MSAARRGRHRAPRTPYLSHPARLVATVLATVALCFSCMATNASASQDWADRAEDAIAVAESLDSGTETPATYAFLAGSIAEVRGWNDPDVQTYLNKVYAQRLASGGYGLGYAWDAFQDGSVNPATTTYAITVTGQVGRVMLDGYQAGAVPKAEIERLVQVTLNMPRSTATGQPGICLSYSSRASDMPYCVPNITASAGKFLTDAWHAGIQLPGQLELMAGLTQRDASTYVTGTGFWPYIQGGSAQNDWNHNAVNVEAELTLSPAIGQESLDAMMALTTPAKWVDPLGKVALLPYACEHAGGLLDDYDAILSDSRMTASLAAQAAYWAARTASHC